MKKLVMAVLSMLLIALLSISMVACGGAEDVKIIDIKLSDESYAYAVKKGNTELLTKVNEFMEKLKSDEGVGEDGITLDEIVEKEGNGELGNIGTVKTESTNRADELVVSTNAEFAPFEYSDGGKFAGIDMHIAKLMANYMGKTLVILDMKFDPAILAAANGDSDICMAGLTITEKRKETLDFSVEYYQATQKIAVRKSNTTFDECKTAEDVENILSAMKDKKAGAATAQTGYFYLEGDDSFGFKGFSNIEIKPYDTIGLAVKDLSNGKVDFVVADGTTLALVVKGING